LSLFTNDNGGIEDDTIITNLNDHLNVVINAGCKDKDLQNMRNHLENNFKNKDVRIEYLEDKSLIALQGPKSSNVLQQYVAGNLSNLSFMEASNMAMPSINETVLVSRCGYTGEDGFEISVSDKNAAALFEILLKNNEVKPCGLGARDTLRLEAGLCLYGHDINDSTTPIEGSLKWVIGKRRKVEVIYKLIYNLNIGWFSRL
jgi:aminomethyltransferase